MHNLSHLQGREADEAAIRTLCQQLNEAWGDADAFAAASLKMLITLRSMARPQRGEPPSRKSIDRFLRAS